MSRQPFERSRRPVLSTGPRRRSAIFVSWRATRRARALWYAVALAYFGHQRAEEFLGQALYHTCNQTRPQSLRAFLSSDRRVCSVDSAGQLFAFSLPPSPTAPGFAAAPCQVSFGGRMWGVVPRRQPTARPLPNACRIWLKIPPATGCAIILEQ